MAGCVHLFYRISPPQPPPFVVVFFVSSAGNGTNFNIISIGNEFKLWKIKSSTKFFFQKMEFQKMLSGSGEIWRVFATCCFRFPRRSPPALTGSSSPFQEPENSKTKTNQISEPFLWIIELEKGEERNHQIIEDSSQGLTPPTPGRWR